MVSREKHEAACRIFLGYPFTEMHRAIDSPSQELGRKHRKYFHNCSQILHLAFLCFSEDPLSNLKAGLIHIIQDKGCEAVEEIEIFLSNILQGKVNPKLAENLAKEYFKEIYNLLVHLCGGGYVDYKKAVVKFVKDDDYFETFLEYSRSEGYSTRLAKKLESLKRGSNLLPLLFAHSKQYL